MKHLLFNVVESFWQSRLSEIMANVENFLRIAYPRSFSRPKSVLSGAVFTA